MPEPRKPTTLDSLGPDCLHKVCQYLDKKDLLNAARTTTLNYTATYRLYKNDIDTWHGRAEGLHYGALHNLKSCVEWALSFDTKINHSRPYVVGHRRGIRQKADRAGTALHIAAGEGHNDMVKFLLEKGAEINAYSARFPRVNGGVEKGTWVDIPFENGPDDDLSPLYAAIAAGHEDTARLLIEEGASLTVSRDMREPDHQPYPGSKLTALHVAARAGLRSLMDSLLDEYDLDINQRDSEGYTPLQWAASSSRGASHVEYLISRGADVNSTAYGEMTALHSAMEVEDDDMAIKTINILLDAGANHEINSIYAPLDFAVEQCRLEIIRVFLSRGCVLDSSTFDSLTTRYDNPSPRERNSRTELKACIEVILAHGAVQDMESSLMDCIVCSNVDSAQLLFKHGARLPILSKEQLDCLVCEINAHHMFTPPGLKYLVRNFDALTEGRMEGYVFDFVINDEDEQLGMSMLCRQPKRQIV